MLYNEAVPWSKLRRKWNTCRTCWEKTGGRSSRILWHKDQIEMRIFSLWMDRPAHQPARRFNMIGWKLPPLLHFLIFLFSLLFGENYFFFLCISFFEIYVVESFSFRWNIDKFSQAIISQRAVIYWGTQYTIIKNRLYIMNIIQYSRRHKYFEIWWFWNFRRILFKFMMQFAEIFKSRLFCSL